MKHEWEWTVNVMWNDKWDRDETPVGYKVRDFDMRLDATTSTEPLTDKQVTQIVREFRRQLIAENKNLIAEMQKEEPDEYAAWRRCPQCQGTPNTNSGDNFCGVHSSDDDIEWHEGSNLT